MLRLLTIRLLRVLLICLPMLIPRIALAAAYSLPADIGSGPFSSCSGSGPGYSCSGDVSLNNNDSVSLSANVTLNINGDFEVGKNALIDSNGFIFNLAATGDINIGDDAQVNINLDAAGKIEIGKKVTLNGDLSAGTEVKIGDDANITGNIDSGGKVDIGKRIVLSGNIDANDEVKIGDDATINGNITTSGKIDIKKRGSITGDLDANDDIKIDKDVVITGDVTTTGNLDIDTGSVVNGNCTPNHPQCSGTPPPVGGACDTFRDIFLGFGYDNQDGTLNWSTDWIEVGDDGSHAGGAIRLQNNALRLRGGGSAVNLLGGPYVQREADLSAFVSATLSFSYFETGGWEADDQVDVYVSGDGGGSWTLIQSFIDDQGTNPQIFSIDISGYISSNTRIAFVERADSNGENFFVDDVQIEACIAPVDHFNIIPATTGASTCLPNAITIVAADAADNPIPNYTNTVDISVSTNHGNWSVNDADNVTVPNPDSDDDGAVSYSFLPSDLGEIILDLSHTRAQSLTISVTDAAAAVTSTSAVITFADNVFVISEDPVQVAGRPQAIRIEMWFRDAGPSPSCGPDPNYNYAHDLDVGIDRGGVLIGANPPSIGGVPINNGPPAAVPFSFAAGVATFDLDTTDVGQYRLTFTDNNLVHIPTAISGDSSVLTVRPFGIGVSNIVAGATVNPGGSAAGDPIFTAAGADFSADVAGVLWDPLDDTEGGVGDGVIDVGRVFADNPPAPSYAWDTNLSVSAAPLSFTPATGTSGSLNNGSVALADFSGGSFNLAGLQYTEVGSFTLQSLAADYLASGLDIPGDDIVVGRFVPATFTVENIAVGQFADSCGAFTYIGESFSYATAPTFTVTARNALGAPTTQYRDGFAKLGGSSVTLDVGDDETTLGTDSNPMAVSFSAAAAMGFSVQNDGTVDYSFGADSYRYGPDPVTTFSKFSNSRVAPFPADINPEIRTVNDGEVAVTYAVDLYQFDTVGNNQRFGRLRMENVHGSELNDLVMPVTAEYWDGIAFQRNLLDTCTSIPDADLVTVAEDPVGLSTPTVIGAPAMAGEINYNYPSPGDGNDGYVETRTDLDPPGPGNHLWLRYDWDGDGEFDDDPVARATFGIFDGNPVQIYIQQIFQQ